MLTILSRHLCVSWLYPKLNLGYLRDGQNAENLVLFAPRKRLLRRLIFLRNRAKPMWCDAIRSYSNDLKYIRKRVLLVYARDVFIQWSRGFNQMPAGDCVDFQNVVSSPNPRLENLFLFKKHPIKIHGLNRIYLCRKKYTREIYQSKRQLLTKGRAIAGFHMT